jgi:hypothetical protein
MGDVVIEPSKSCDDQKKRSPIERVVSDRGAVPMQGGNAEIEDIDDGRVEDGAA